MYTCLCTHTYVHIDMYTYLCTFRYVDVRIFTLNLKSYTRNPELNRTVKKNMDSGIITSPAMFIDDMKLIFQVLQCVAVRCVAWCSVLHHISRCVIFDMTIVFHVCCSVLQCVAVCCIVLQCVTVCCSMCVAVCCSMCVAVRCVVCCMCCTTSPAMSIYDMKLVFQVCRVLHCVAVRCVMRCRVLQCDVSFVVSHEQFLSHARTPTQTHIHTLPPPPSQTPPLSISFAHAQTLLHA